MGQHGQGAEPDSAPHGLRGEPNLPAAGNPFGAVIKCWVQKDPVVRSPTATDLGNAILKNRHPGPDETTEHGLHYSGAEIEAADARDPIQGGHQVALIANRFSLGGVLARLRTHGGIPQRDGQRCQGNVEVAPAVHHSRHDGMAVGQHRHGVDAFRAGRLEPAVEISGERGTTGPRLDERVPAGRMSFGMEDMAVNGDRSLTQQR